MKAAQYAAFLVALCVIGVGMFGVIAPEDGSAVRRLYFATPAGLYAAAAIRTAMGVVVIVSGPGSRAPRILQAMGSLMCVQAAAATLMGPDRARAILEWETLQGPAVLRVGAAVALVAGVFIAFAVTPRRRKND